MSYFEKENEARQVPAFAEEEVPQGATYRCKFIEAGPVGYKDGVYLLPQENLDQFAWTLKNKPVVIGHQDIEDMDDMKTKAVGMVTAVERCPETGRWFCDFCVWDDKAITKISNGDLPYVSCAYRADLTTEGCDINNVKYKKRIVGGEMLHLALVKNPRYNGTEIWRNSADDYFVGEGALYNEKENTMFGFKKVKTELDKDTLVNTKIGDLTLEELVNEVETAHATIAEQKDKIAALEARNADLEAAAKVEPKTEPAGDPKIDVVTEQVQPKAEETAPVTTDAEFKKDLNNALAGDVKTVVIQVPNVK